MGKIQIKRFKSDKDSTISLFLYNGAVECFAVEDQKQTKKVFSETRIPEGVYDVSLRKAGGHHARYSNKFPDIHRGMLCIHNSPDWKLVNAGMSFQYILIHIGNTDDHTAGCILVNESVNSRTLIGSGSTDAYKRVYKKIVDDIQRGEKITIEVIDIEN